VIRKGSLLQFIFIAKKLRTNITYRHYVLREYFAVAEVLEFFRTISTSIFFYLLSSDSKTGAISWDT
jgi:hypothetical protein